MRLSAIGGSTACTTMDVIAISGPATLAGALKIDLIDGCQPALGQQFTIMTYASHTGSFDSAVNRCAGAGLMFDVSYEARGVTLHVVEQPAANGDLDFNGVLDLRDFALFQVCFSGKAGTVAPCCEQANLDVGNTIDLTDFAAFTSLLPGP